MCSGCFKGIYFSPVQEDQVKVGEWNSSDKVTPATTDNSSSTTIRKELYKQNIWNANNEMLKDTEIPGD